MLRKMLLVVCMLVGIAILGGGHNLELPIMPDAIGMAEAAGRPSVGITPRELKKNRQGESSDLYARAHHIIYGKKGPLGADGRVRIAVIINGEEGIIVENRVKNQIYQQLRNKFPRDSFAVMKGTDVNTYLLTRAEDERYDSRKGISQAVPQTTYNYNQNGVSESRGYVHVGNQQNDVDGVPVGHRPRGLADMRLNDYVDAGRHLGYDYVFILTMNLGERTKYQHGLIPFLPITHHTSKQNVWVRARFVDIKDGEYVYRNDLPAMGKTHNGHFNGRIFEDSVRIAVEEIMDDIMVNED